MSMKEISENNLSYLLELIATHIKSEVSSIIVDVATNNSFGLVKPDNSTITINSGVISATATSPSIATTNSTGIVKPDDDTIGVQNDGTIYSKITYYTSSELDTMWANAYGGSSSGSGSSGSGSSGSGSSGSGSSGSGSDSGTTTNNEPITINLNSNYYLGGTAADQNGQSIYVTPLAVSQDGTRGLFITSGISTGRWNSPGNLLSYFGNLSTAVSNILIPINEDAQSGDTNVPTGSVYWYSNGSSGSMSYVNTYKNKVFSALGSNSSFNTNTYDIWFDNGEDSNHTYTLNKSNIKYAYYLHKYNNYIDTLDILEEGTNEQGLFCPSFHLDLTKVSLDGSYIIPRTIS